MYAISRLPFPVHPHRHLTVIWPCAALCARRFLPVSSFLFPCISFPFSPILAPARFLSSAHSSPAAPFLCPRTHTLALLHHSQHIKLKYIQKKNPPTPNTTFHVHPPAPSIQVCLRIQRKGQPWFRRDHARLGKCVNAHPLCSYPHAIG